MLTTQSNTSSDKCCFGQSQWHNDGDFKLDERMKVGHVTVSREGPTSDWMSIWRVIF